MHPDNEFPANHEAQAGSPGHQGPDRQPGRHIGNSAQPTPDAAQAASPKQVRSRSKKAMHRPKDARHDPNHPGPQRDESEISKGNAHHDQHEPQPDMQDDVKPL